MKKYRWLYIIALLISAIGYIATDKKQILVLLIFLVFIFIFSSAFWLISCKSFNIELEVEDVSVCKRSLSTNIVLYYSGKFPAGPIVLNMEYENLIFDHIERQEIVLNTSGRKRAEYSLPYVPKYCGKTFVKIKSAKSYDFLGVLNKKILENESREIIIYPNIKELAISKKNVASIREFGEYYDPNQKGNDVFEVFDMRDYHNGDNIKSIHWKLSSKFDRLIIREYSNPTNYHTAMYYNTFVKDTTDIEEALELKNRVLQMAASLSKTLIQNGFAHHIVTVDNLKENTKFVQDNNSYLQGIAEMMSKKIMLSFEEFNNELDFLAQDNRFSNLFYVCSYLDTEHISSMANQCNIIVIYINNKHEESVEESKNYTIYSIPTEKIDGNLKAIEF